MRKLKSFISGVLLLDLYRDYIARFRAEKVVIVQNGETLTADNRTLIVYSKVRR